MRINRILSRLAYADEEEPSFLWIYEGTYKENDPLFAGKEFDYEFIQTNHYCVVCGKLADSFNEVNESYCHEHLNKINLCRRNWIIKEKPSCITKKEHCYKYNTECNRSLFSPYLAISNISRGIKVGSTNDDRIGIRAKEQGASVLIPLIYEDGYPLTLFDAQLVEQIFSGFIFGFNCIKYSEDEYISDNYRPTLYADILGSLSTDPIEAETKIRNNYEIIVQHLITLIKDKIGDSSHEMELINHLELADKAIIPMYDQQIDTEQITKVITNKVPFTETKISNGIIGTQIALKGNVLIVKNINRFFRYNIKHALGLMEKKSKQTILEGLL